jgi:hypothetical protein
MTHIGSKRSYGGFGRRIARYFSYRRAKRLYSEIDREISFFESKFMKARLHHA